MWNPILIHLEIVLVLVNERSTVCAQCSTSWKLFLMHMMELLGDMGLWNFVSIHLKTVLVSVCLEIVLILTQDRCMVCAYHTIGSEIVLDTPDGTPM
jgi:hypothetical protein